MFATAESAQDLMKNLEPLLLEAAEIAKELRPMLQNVQEQGRWTRSNLRDTRPRR